MSSFKVEVIADSTGNWCGNGLRFHTEDDAKSYAVDLSSRWTAVLDHRVVPSDDAPKHYWDRRTFRAEFLPAKEV